ncbi:11160_t:CDS:2, partial [Acaulospora morrowiae]
EPGKNWETYENERYESDEDHNRDDSWDDWNEEESQPTLCLFCEDVSPSSKEVQNHMRNIHGFDLLEIKNSMGLDFYQTIILINYIRHSTSLNACIACGAKFDKLQNLTEHMTKENCFTKVPPLDNPLWKDPKYLIPTQTDDPLLGFEDDSTSEDDNDDLSLNFPNGATIIPEKAPDEVKEQIRQMLTSNYDEFRRGIIG